MTSRTWSARPETSWSGPAPLVPLPSVGTGGQNSMIQFDGSGTAPIGPSHGNSGVTGKYGSRNSRAMDREFPIIG